MMNIYEELKEYLRANDLSTADVRGVSIGKDMLGPPLTRVKYLEKGIKLPFHGRMLSIKGAIPYLKSWSTDSEHVFKLFVWLDDWVVELVRYKLSHFCFKKTPKHHTAADLGCAYKLETIQIDYNPDYEEYRVPGIDGNEASAYYTHDKGDAIQTAQHIHGKECEIKV